MPVTKKVAIFAFVPLYVLAAPMSCGSSPCHVTCADILQGAPNEAPSDYTSACHAAFQAHTDILNCGCSLPCYSVCSDNLCAFDTENHLAASEPCFVCLGMNCSQEFDNCVKN
jgi:hypothetical protein